MSTVLSENSLAILKKRYLNNGESVDSLWDRVSGGNPKFRELMSSLRFLPNSPTLFNAGLNNGCTLSACFVLNVSDCMLSHEGVIREDSIVRTREKAIMIAKAGGGVGYYFGDLRPKGKPIKSIQRVACGPVAVLRDYHMIHKLITQGGKRDLAQMGVLPCWHEDIKEFIHAKDSDPQGLSSFNISISWTDEWVKKAFYQMDNGIQGKESDLWNEQVESAWKHGCPGMLFYDTVNRDNPNKHLGLIKATNPCVVGDTLVLTKNGEFSIQDLVDQEVEVWNGEVWSKVTPKITGRNVTILKVTLEDGRTLHCTENHRFPWDINTSDVDCEEMMEIRHLKPGDSIIDYPMPNSVLKSIIRIKTIVKLSPAEIVYCFTDPISGRGTFNRIVTGQCGETPNRSDEPCSLGSLSLPRYFNKGQRSLNWTKLGDDVVTCIEFMDDILDRNVFPHPDIDKAARLTRKLGLGVMGWADLLALMHIHYDTQEAVNLGESLMKHINEIALATSERLAKEKGPYIGYDECKTEGPFVRNETRTSIAPTGTIAIIADVWGSIEPHFALSWDRTTYEGMKLKEHISCWDSLEGFVPHIANEIDVEWHVKHQAAFQKHTNLGCSKTINLPKHATKEDVSKAYRLMYESGCKGGTVFRDGCREDQVLVSNKTKSVFALENTPSRKKMPPERQSITHKFKVGGTECYITAGLFEDGTPGEVFIRASKLGSSINGMLDTWAIAFSISLQNGTSLEDACEHHVGARFEPSGITNNPDLPVCSSIPDYVVRWLEYRFLGKKKEESVSIDSGVFCPECGNQAAYQAGCLVCTNKTCGWSRCN